MPRNKTATRNSAMDVRIAAMEANVAALSDSMESKLNGFFEQFRREIACSGLEGASSSVVYHANPPLEADPTSSRNDDLFRQSFDGEGFNPRPHWQHRIDFPHFTPGEYPSTWVYKAEQFFAYYSTPVHQQVPTVSFHLDGDALQWFRWMNCLQTIPRWEDFTLAFCREFGLLSLKIVLRHSSNCAKQVQYRTILLNFVDWLIELQI